MATPEEILELRRLIDEPTQDPYTDAVLGVRIDASESLRALASGIWREKAATYAGLVDVKEGSSDRKLSQLHKSALAMADGLALPEITVPETEVRRPGRTRPIERP